MKLGVLIVCIVVALFACGLDVAKQRAQNAIDVGNYSAELQECKRKGKEARSMVVYERCAEEVDRKYAVEAKDGGY